MKVPIPIQEINKIRQLYPADCMDAAEAVDTQLNMDGTAIITLKNGHAFMDGGIQIYNQHAKKWRLFTHHVILATPDGVVDILNSDDIIPLEDYLDALDAVNKKLRVDTTLCYGYLHLYPIFKKYCKRGEYWPE